MKKILTLVLALVVAVAILFPVSLAAADVGPAVDDPDSVAKPQLSIRSQGTAVQGEMIKILVYERFGGAGVARAGVWAVGFKNTNETAVTVAALSAPGFFLGWTDEEGVLVYAFKEVDSYVLAAVKDFYLPGFARINVKAAPMKSLAIKAPQQATVWELVPIYVYERYTGSSVPKAGIWAISPDIMPSLGSDKETAAYASKHGEFLGYTNENGLLEHRFNVPGTYLLVAVKEGYIPGLAKIQIEEMKALVIKAPEAVLMGRPIPIRVLELSVLTIEIPVPKAGVWAVPVANIPTTSNSADIPDNQVLANTARIYGRFLGWTNEDGYVDPTPSINQPGQYWLVAIKEGWVPGVTKITIKPLLTATPTILPKPLPATVVPVPEAVKPTILPQSLKPANAEPEPSNSLMPLASELIRVVLPILKIVAP